MDRETGTVLTTAPLYRCSNRLLATILFPRDTVNYVVVGNDSDGRPFSTLLSSATFIHKIFRVEIEGDTPIEVEDDETLSLVVRVYNMHASSDVRYTFTAEPVTGFQQAFHPTSLRVPPGESGSVNMTILQGTAEPGSSYTFTATVSDGCITQSASKAVSIQLQVSKIIYHLIQITKCSYL